MANFDHYRVNIFFCRVYEVYRYISYYILTNSILLLIKISLHSTLLTLLFATSRSIIFTRNASVRYWILLSIFLFFVKVKELYFELWPGLAQTEKSLLSSIFISKGDNTNAKYYCIAPVAPIWSNNICLIRSIHLPSLTHTHMCSVSFVCH